MTEKDIRERITQLRMEHNLSEYKLSRKAGASDNYIQSISSGRTLPSIRMLMRICTVFEIELSEFFETKMPSLAARELRDEMDGLSDEDIRHLIYIVKRMKEQKKD